jgi:hypothetical protein
MKQGMPLCRSTVEQALAYAPKADIALVDLGLADGNTGAQPARRLIDRFGIEVIFAPEVRVIVPCRFEVLDVVETEATNDI